MALKRIKETMIDNDFLAKIEKNYSPSARMKDTFVATEGQTVFTLSKKYRQFANVLQVIIGGVEQKSGENYAETSETSFTLAVGLPAGTKVIAYYYDKDLLITSDVDTELNGMATSITGIDSKVDTEIAKVNEQLAHTTQDIDVLSKKQIVRKYEYKHPSENLNISFANYPDGDFKTLEDFQVLNGSAEIKNGSVFINGIYTNGEVLHLFKNPNNKILRFKVKTPNHYFAVLLRHHEDFSKKLMLWTGFSDKLIGIGVLDKNNTVNQTWAKSSWTIPTTEDYWIEVHCGLVETGETITIHCWTDAQGYANKQTFSHTLVDANIKVKTGRITFSVAGGSDVPLQIEKIQLYDGLKYQNSLKDNYYYLGRWFTKWVNWKDTMTTINNGSAIYCKVKGTASIVANFELMATLNYIPLITYSIDGGTETKVAMSSTVTLATGLDPTKEYVVKIYASSIYWLDGCWTHEKGVSFSGLTVDKNATIEPYFPQNKRVLFFGDSITHGANAVGSDKTIMSNSAGEVAFPSIVCRELSTIPLQVGYPGTGLTQASSDGMAKMSFTIDYKTSGQLNTDERPDIIVLNIGTNDYATNATTFKDTYRIFIKKLIQRFGNVPIFMCDGFTARRYVAEMQALANEFSNCLYIDTSSVSIPTTDGTHPNTTGHENVGVFIAEFIKNNIKDIS